MNIRRITPQDYLELFGAPSHIYNSVAFNELNRHKCDDIHYLISEDEHGKPRLGLILGERGDVLASPFSAPFGGVEQIKQQRVRQYIDFVDSLSAYGKTLGKEIRLTLPPHIYDRDGNVEKLLCALLTRGARRVATEYNYHYPTERFQSYVEFLPRDERTKFRKACKAGFGFEVLGNSADDIARAYGVIKKNRESHGYPLRMSLDDVLATTEVVGATFMVMSYEGEDVAAVQAFDVSPEIVQIIYWGDVPGYSALRPMRFLAYKVFEHFAGKKTIVDVGPSSSDGIPSLGLCDFKEEVGCVLTPKSSFVL